jgi:hypothetical protein
MKRLALALFAIAGAAFAHTAEPAGPPPSETGAFAGVLQKDGIRIKDGTKTVMELWFANTVPHGAKTPEENVTLATVPHGAFMGIARFPERGADRRGQTIKPGVYTMRLSFFPQNGDHQGVAPQRDFFLLTAIADDKDPKANPTYDVLTKASIKAAGTPHPLVFGVWKADTGFKPGIAQEGEHDWVLQHKIGDLPFAMIVVGKSEH